MMPMKITYRSKGVALIMAILITSMVSIAAVAMITQQQLDIRRTQNILHFDQAYVYVLGAEEWAKGFLLQDTTKEHDFYPVSEKDVDVIGLPIAEEVKQSGMDIGGISGIITDASASFPINNIVKNDGTKEDRYAEVFDYLVSQALASGEDSLSQGFSDGVDKLVLDWIDKDDNVSTGGAEDLDYLNLPKNPYRTPNQSIASVSEMRLMLVLSEDAENAKNVYAALARPRFNPLNAVSLEAIEQQPLVNALPRGAKININTAPKVVLRALVDYVRLGNTISGQIVSDFDEMRREAPQTSVEEFKDLIDVEVKATDPRRTGGSTPPENSPEMVEFREKSTRANKVKEMIDVKSEYFYLTAQSQIGEVNVLLISLLHRKDDKVTTLRRGIGVI